MPSMYGIFERKTIGEACNALIMNGGATKSKVKELKEKLLLAIEEGAGSFEFA